MEQIDPRHLLVRVAQILDELGIPYIVTGGIAVFVWGRPRFTDDIDIVVELKTEKIDQLAEKLQSLSEASYVDANMMRDALRHQGEFNFIDGSTGVKIDFWISKEDEFNLNRFARKVTKNILGKDIYFISPEDLILAKLLWQQISPSSKQFEDVESIFKISGDQLDLEYLAKWAEKLGVQDLYAKVKKD
ncbi:MAG: nucleotidyltransferase [Candidatus Wildermuthbacteria bacterium]|nr:nucleotidyltransferase [Candidatus Wildermuthbacteria bacterium]